MRRVRLTGDEARFAWDPADPEGFAGGRDRIGRRLGAVRTGASLYELPPGQAVCPYHYEHAEEEWLLVVEGEVAVRTPEGTETLGPWELAFFPTGPEGAHGIRNDSDRTARVLMWSEVVHPAVTVYPDSDKLGVYVGDGSDDLIVRRGDGVGYYEGEAAPPD
jgi:uncharacterized cupin superfamily protein